MKIPLVVIALLSFLWPWSSGKTYQLIASSMVPAATGSVKAKRDKQNKDTTLDIKVEHLAKPRDLTPPANVYLVWALPRAGEPVKLGAIGVGNDLKGQLKAVTVLRNFQLVITAEQSETVTAPSNVEVLHADISLG